MSVQDPSLLPGLVHYLAVVKKAVVAEQENPLQQKYLAISQEHEQM